MPTGQRPKKSKYAMKESIAHHTLNWVEDGSFKWSNKKKKDIVISPTGKIRTRKFSDGGEDEWFFDEPLRAAAENRDTVLQDRFLDNLYNQNPTWYNKIYDKYNGKRREMIVGYFKAARTNNKLFHIIRESSNLALT